MLGLKTKTPEVKNRLFVTVRTRRGLTFEGELFAVSSFNQVGAFDVLPDHSNFVSMIAKRLILHKPDGRKEELNVDKGVIMVEKNRVQVFIGIGSL